MLSRASRLTHAHKVGALLPRLLSSSAPSSSSSPPPPHVTVTEVSSSSTAIPSSPPSSSPQAPKVTHTSSTSSSLDPSSSSSHPLHLTPSCAARISAFAAKRDAPHRLRVSVDPGGCSGFEYVFEIEPSDLTDPEVREGEDEI